MSYGLSQRSLGLLEGVHGDLVAVVRRAIELTTVDFSVIEGLRTLARQEPASLLLGAGSDLVAPPVESADPAPATPAEAEEPTHA